MAKKGNREVMMLTATKEELERIRKYCAEEGLYMGRFLARLAIRHIEEVEEQRLKASLDKMGIK
jgi:hypothetical protein